MKKLFITFLSIGSFLTAFSQEKGSFEFGIAAGLNTSTVQTGTATNSSVRIGFNAGAFGDYYFSDRWSIKLKLAYDQKGWNDGFINDLNNGTSTKTNYHLDYLNIPVMASWHFGKSRNWYLNFGPYVGILLSANETALNMDLKDYMQSTDFGLGAGIGVKIPVSDKIKILIETDGQGGITDIIHNNQGTRFQNNRFSINTGLVFAL